MLSWVHNEKRDSPSHPSTHPARRDLSIRWAITKKPAASTTYSGPWLVSLAVLGARSGFCHGRYTMRYGVRPPGAPHIF